MLILFLLASSHPGWPWNIRPSFLLWAVVLVVLRAFVVLFKLPSRVAISHPSGTWAVIYILVYFSKLLRCCFMPVPNMCVLGVSKELIPSIKGFHFPASFCLWFPPYFSALGESVFLLLITKLDFNLPALLHSFHKWVSLCLKAEDREKIMGILFTLVWLQRPPFPIPQAWEKYFLWEV